MFHFLCPVCGSSPESVILRDYLTAWENADIGRTKSFLGTLCGILNTLNDAERLTKKFKKSISKTTQTLGKIEFINKEIKFDFLKQDGRDLYFDRTCPVCGDQEGKRRKGNYFKEWNEACGVQIGNLLYESNLILWALLRGIPDWLDGRTLEILNESRVLLIKNGRDLGAMECPKCGRFVFHLYGGLTAEQDGFCRWCMDMGGGFGLSFSIEETEGDEIDLKRNECDYDAPSKSILDILPPEMKNQAQQGRREEF